MRYTQDHQLIQLWATKHGAVPAEVKPLKFDGEPVKLHFIFGDDRSGTPEIRPTTWESFFAYFELLNLALSFDECSADFELCTVAKRRPPSHN